MLLLNNSLPTDFKIASTSLSQQLHKTNQGLDRFKTLISEIVENDRFLAFLQQFRKDTANQTL